MLRDPLAKLQPGRVPAGKIGEVFRRVEGRHDAIGDDFADGRENVFGFQVGFAQKLFQIGRDEALLMRDLHELFLRRRYDGGLRPSGRSVRLRELLPAAAPREQFAAWPLAAVEPSAQRRACREARRRPVVVVAAGLRAGAREAISHELLTLRGGLRASAESVCRLGEIVGITNF